MKQTMKTLILALALTVVATAEARNVRATEITSSTWARLQAGMAEDLTVEFRQGDEIPLTLSMAGDFIATVQAAPTMVQVKRSFWLRLREDRVQASLDGIHFKPLSEVASGNLKAGATSDQNGGAVNGINVLLEAFLKN